MTDSILLDTYHNSNGPFINQCYKTGQFKIKREKTHMRAVMTFQ